VEEDSPPQRARERSYVPEHVVPCALAVLVWSFHTNERFSVSPSFLIGLDLQIDNKYLIWLVEH
jgi:hypothetical protein